MFLRLASKLICSEMNFCAKFVTHKRSYSNFGKTRLSETWLMLLQRRPNVICIRFFASKNERKINSPRRYFRWKLIGCIFVGLCISGCACVKYFAHYANAAEREDSITLNPSYAKLIKSIVDQAAQSIVTITTPHKIVTTVHEMLWQGEGSGFIVRSDGFILTSAHVVENSEQILVTLRNGKVYEGFVEHIDEASDLAIVKINASNLPVLKLADSKEAKVGDQVIAMGSHRLLAEPVTYGIIRKQQRNSDKEFGYIKTNTRIYPGNSGGPLINLNGEAIGVNSFGSYIEYVLVATYSIPTSRIKELLDNM